MIIITINNIKHNSTTSIWLFANALFTFDNKNDNHFFPFFVLFFFLHCTLFWWLLFRVHMIINVHMKKKQCFSINYFILMMMTMPLFHFLCLIHTLLRFRSLLSIFFDFLLLLPNGTTNLAKKLITYCTIFPWYAYVLLGAFIIASQTKNSGKMKNATRFTEYSLCTQV